MIKHIPLMLEPFQSVEVPYACEILSVTTINNKPHLCLIGDESYQPVARKLFICSESRDIPLNCSKSSHLGTFEYKDKVETVLYHVFIS